MWKFLCLIFILSYVNCLSTNCNDCPGTSCFATNCSANCSPPNNSINICPCNHRLESTTPPYGDGIGYRCTIEVHQPPCYVDCYSYFNAYVLYYGFKFLIYDCGSNYICPGGSTPKVSGDTRFCLWKIPLTLGIEIAPLSPTSDCHTTYDFGIYGFTFESPYYFHTFSPGQYCDNCCFKEGCDDPCTQPVNQC